MHETVKKLPTSKGGIDFFSLSNVVKETTLCQVCQECYVQGCECECECKYGVCEMKRLNKQLVEKKEGKAGEGTKNTKNKKIIAESSAIAMPDRPRPRPCAAQRAAFGPPRHP